MVICGTANSRAKYKNRASKILADLEMKNNNYQEAIIYLDNTKKY